MLTFEGTTIAEWQEWCRGLFNESFANPQEVCVPHLAALTADIWAKEGRLGDDDPREVVGMRAISLVNPVTGCIVALRLPSEVGV
jgi:hypothetical protein